MKEKSTELASPSPDAGSERPAGQRYNNVDVGGIRRKQIVDAVRRIIARDGLEAVTIANIAQELGTSRGVVIYHFDNKEAILHEVLLSAMNDADGSSLRFERGSGSKRNFARLVAEVAALAQGSSDWWKIYFAFLAQAHVNPFYRDALAWSDERYRRALTERLGDESRATIILALMKGLAMQASVAPRLPVDQVLNELRAVMKEWLHEGEGRDA